MSYLVDHIFSYAEVYAVVLVWLVIPLGFFVAYRRLSGYLDFLATASSTQGKAEKGAVPPPLPAATDGEGVEDRVEKTA